MKISFDEFAQAVEIAEKEHDAGFHKGISYAKQHVCYECYKDYQEYLKGADRHLLNLTDRLA